MQSQLSERTRRTALYGGQLFVVVLLFFGALGNVFLLSFATGPSSIARDGPTLSHYVDVLTSLRIADAAINSLILAAVTTIIAVPLALATARSIVALQSPLARLFVGSLVLLPLLSSPVLRMLGYNLLLSDGGPLAGLTCTWSISCSGFLYTTPAIVVGLVSNVLPICGLVLFVQLLRIPAVELLAAKNLGASPWDIWRRIELPRCAGALIVSSQLCIILALGDLLAPSILGGNTDYTFAAAVSDRMKIDDWTTAAAMSILLVILTCLAMGLVLWMMRRPTRAAPSS